RVCRNLGVTNRARRSFLGSLISGKVPIWQPPLKLPATPKGRFRVGFFKRKSADFLESTVFGKSAQIVHFDASKRASYLASWKDARFRAKRKMRKISPEVFGHKQVGGPHIRRFLNLLPVANRSSES